MFQTAPLKVVGDRYELQRELARGGMGSVWIAKDRKLKRSVAIKVMVPMWAEVGDAAARFEREAMAVAQLQSPHVVQIFDYGVEQDCPYIVMELLEGEDLRQRLLRQERLDLETTGKIVVQAAKALSVAHAAGIIHRDLKPGNIFLARSREEELIKVLDFGVAKVDQDAGNKDEKTKAGTLLGTPQYMSPEQARGLPNIDHRADLWSLAVIAYRALTGRLPFIGKSAADVIVKLCTQDPPVPTTLAPDLPKELDRFFRRALAREASQRFENARQMAVAFSRIAPTSFPSLSMPDPMPFIGEAAEHRARTMPDLDWDDSWQLAPSDHPSQRGSASGRMAVPSEPDGQRTDVTAPPPSSAARSRPAEELAALLAPPHHAEASAVPYPLGEPTAPDVLPHSGLTTHEIALGSSSSATLASGLVDVTPSGHAPRKRRPIMLVGVLLALLAAGGGAVMGRRMLSGGGERPLPVGATTTPTESLEPASAASAAATDELPTTVPAPTATEALSSDTSSAPAPSDVPSDAVRPPGRTPPGTTAPAVRPKQPPGAATGAATAPPTPTKTADPFSERL